MQISDAALQPEFWDQRYRANKTPWDLGGVPGMLQKFLAAQKIPAGHASRRVLIPGCGSGYQIEAFVAAGFAVTAIDISPTAVERAREHMSAAVHGNAKILLRDFFTQAFDDAPFDCVHERTFLCALPPGRWPSVVERSASLLKPGGLLAGFYFFGENDDGPPFGLAPGEDARLF